MSQFPHDEFAKEYLPELCQEYGIVTPSVDVMSEKREVDVMFTPTKPVNYELRTMNYELQPTPNKIGKKECILLQKYSLQVLLLSINCRRIKIPYG